MTLYGLIIPQMTLLIGLLASLMVSINTRFNDRALKLNQWGIGAAVLLFALIQQLLLYRAAPTLFLRGGMVLDGISQLMSVSILTLALLIHLNRRHQTKMSSHIHVLFLTSILLAVFFVQTNRIFFGILTLAALVLSTYATLAAEEKSERQPAIAYFGVLKSLAVLGVGVLLTLSCLLIFGESQFDEMHRALMRKPIGPELIFALEGLILFFGVYFSGFPPFSGFLSLLKKQSSWPLALGYSALFAIIGLNVFIRWGVMLFSAPSSGALELEAFGETNILEYVQIISVFVLLFVPAMALFSDSIKKSLVYFVLNPSALVLFGISFGKREVFGFAASQIFLSVFLVGIILFVLKMLNVSENAKWEEWRGVGRRHFSLSLVFLGSVAALAGLAPFFSSLLIQRTLCINSPVALFVLGNVSLGGIFVARLAIWAFQEGRAGDSLKRGQETMRTSDRLLIFVQVALLIFVGIFWQPLYKYGAYSVRNIFGDNL